MMTISSYEESVEAEFLEGRRLEPIYERSFVHDVLVDVQTLNELTERLKYAGPFEISQRSKECQYTLFKLLVSHREKAEEHKHYAEMLSFAYLTLKNWE